MECSARYAAPFDEKNKTSDLAYQEIERNMNYYKWGNVYSNEIVCFRKRTKVFLIDLPFYWSNITMAYEMAKRLRRGKPVDDLRIAKNVKLC